jgi:hypothetical protein
MCEGYEIPEKEVILIKNLKKRNNPLKKKSL